jgi:hypothetical protein
MRQAVQIVEVVERDNSDLGVPLKRAPGMSLKVLNWLLEGPGQRVLTIGPRILSTRLVEESPMIGFSDRGFDQMYAINDRTPLEDRDVARVWLERVVLENGLGIIVEYLADNGFRVLAPRRANLHDDRMTDVPDGVLQILQHLSHLSKPLLSASPLFFGRYVT